MGGAAKLWEDLTTVPAQALGVSLLRGRETSVVRPPPGPPHNHMRMGTGLTRAAGRWAHTA